MIIDIYNTDNKYDLLLADPPWKNSKGGKKRVRPNSTGKDSPYPYDMLSMDEIKEQLQQAQSLCEKDHVLFLWTIDKYLYEAEEMAKDLGYKLHARMIWNKVTGIPTAFTVRYGHEYLLYMYHGKFTPVSKESRGKYHTVFTEKVKKHSQKPECVYKMINKMYPTQRKLELYARNEYQGFDCWGNEM